MCPLIAGVLTRDPVPAAKDVTAGWTALAMFIAAIVIVFFLCRSFVKQLRKTNAAAERGVFGDPPASRSRE